MNKTFKERLEQIQSTELRLGYVIDDNNYEMIIGGGSVIEGDRIISFLYTDKDQVRLESGRIIDMRKAQHLRWSYLNALERGQVVGYNEKGIPYIYHGWRTG